MIKMVAFEVAMQVTDVYIADILHHVCTWVYQAVSARMTEL